MTETISPEALGELAEKLGNAAKSFADADKVRTEADQLRITIEKDRQLIQNALDKAAAELETTRIAQEGSRIANEGTRIANEKTRIEAEGARVDKLITQLTGAVPDLSSLQKNTVTFSEGKVPRQSEAIAGALHAVATRIAGQVKEALSNQETATIFVTSEPRLVMAIAGYRQLVAEAGLLKDKLMEARGAKKGRLEGARPLDDVSRFDLVPGAGIVASAVAGKVLTEVASLFEMDVAVTSSSADIPAATVQASVIQKLLVRDKDGQSLPNLTVQHQWARIPDSDSELHQALVALTSEYLDAVGADAALETQLAELTTLEETLAAARKIAGDKSTSETERAQAEATIKDAEEKLEVLPARKRAKSVLESAIEQAKAFTERITTVDSGTGESPLMSAHAVEPLAQTGDNPSSPADAGEPEGQTDDNPPTPADATKPVTETRSTPHVLLLGGAKAEANQVVVTRRILAPRVHISTSVEAQYLLVQGTSVLAAGHLTDSAAYTTKLAYEQQAWLKIPALRPDERTVAG